LWSAPIVAATAAGGNVLDRMVRVLEVAPGVPVSVEITVGDVAVRSWEHRRIEVEVTRRADDRARLLPVEVDQAAAGVRVRAVQDGDGRDPRLRTDVTLRVPTATDVKEIVVFEGRVEVAGLRGACNVRVERGGIGVRDHRGMLRLETVIGDIQVEHGVLAPDSPLRLRTFNGGIDLELAASPLDARILALSMGGTIASDIPLTLKDRWGPRFGEATIGRGDPLVSLDAVNGDIAIRVRK
jgi:hypothetical protein